MEYFNQLSRIIQSINCKITYMEFMIPDEALFLDDEEINPQLSLLYAQLAHERQHMLNLTPGMLRWTKEDPDSVICTFR